jgi:putative acetyltransferase
VFLRREAPADAEVVTRIHDSAFGTAPTVQAQLVVDLRADGDLIPELCLLALVDDEPVGHVCCSPGWIDGRRVVAVGPLGVLPDHQRAGVGSALMHAAVAAADAMGERAVVLLGSPLYYARFGFVLAEPLGITSGKPEWAPYLQVRPLTVDGSVRGTFSYAPAFQRLPDA